MSWQEVGQWLKSNAGTGTALVGSLLTGNVPSAVAMGISLVTSATGKGDVKEALEALQTSPESLVKLKELYYESEKDIRKHIQEMTRLELEDNQKSHEQTQLTVRSGDNSDKWFVWFTRPAQSWLSLGYALWYVETSESIDPYILGLLLTLPFTYAGLREFGKWSTDKLAATLKK